jgi:putative hydrolase of the HAD superfamily
LRPASNCWSETTAQSQEAAFVRLSYLASTVKPVQALIVFDGDDTLWRAEQLYDDAREHAAAIAAEAGFDPEHWTRLQKEIDMANVASLGLSPQRFPLSSVLAYERVATECGAKVSNEIKRRIRQASAEVFYATASLMPGARNVVAQLARTHRLALLTQGDPVVQGKRIADSGLASYFDIIRIVDQKHDHSFAEVLVDTGTAPGCAWSVGNSIPSDINPALRIGMSAIWIDAHVWAHERRESVSLPGDVIKCSSLLEVSRIVQKHTELVQ